LPDWPTVRERMLAPKPPLVCTAYAIGRDPLRIHYADGTFRLPSGSPLVGEAWITSAIEPRRFVRLGEADGAVTGREDVGRACVIAEVRGLRGATAMRLWIDEEIGCIRRMERADDPAPLVVLDDLVVADHSDSGNGTDENSRHSATS
jgi:hypothetical protein